MTFLQLMVVGGVGGTGALHQNVVSRGTWWPITTATIQFLLVGDNDVLETTMGSTIMDRDGVVR